MNRAGRELLHLQEGEVSGKRYIDLFMGDAQNDVFNDILFDGVQNHETYVGITTESLRQIFGGFYHARDTDLYTTKKPFDFGAGGKGLDLLRLKILSKAYSFQIECESVRCRFIPLESDLCPGTVEACGHVQNAEECARTGGATFRLIFPVC
jgi:hypothetical protein